MKKTSINIAAVLFIFGLFIIPKMSVAQVGMYIYNTSSGISEIYGEDEGRYDLVYLDVWEQQLEVIEDEEIKEEGLPENQEFTRISYIKKDDDDSSNTTE